VSATLKLVVCRAAPCPRRPLVARASSSGNGAQVGRVLRRKALVSLAAMAAGRPRRRLRL
jgi:hypothetical protein